MTHTLNQNCTSLCFYPDEKCLSAEKFVRSNLSSILLQFKAHVKHRDDKIQTNFNNLFTCPTKQNAVRNAFMSVSAKSVDNLTQYLLTVSKELDVKLTNYSKNGSNWAISKILSINFKTHKYCPIANVSGRSFIETPRFIYMKKCCVNVKNVDSKCFLYSILAVLHYNDITNGVRNRVSSYKPFENELNLIDITFPMRLLDITKFEKKQ